MSFQFGHWISCKTGEQRSPWTSDDGCPYATPSLHDLETLAHQRFGCGGPTSTLARASDL